MKVVKQLLYLFLLVGLMSSCGDDESFDSETPNDSETGYDQAMRNYMDAKGWIGLPTVDGMYYVIDVPGGVVKPTANSDVTVNYKGYYTDDVEFDSNSNISFNLQGVIEGWTIGIPKFGKGGKGHLLIPPNLAYGEINSRVRNKSVLIFDVELINF